MSQNLSTSQIMLAHQGIEEALTRFQMEDFTDPYNLPVRLLKASDVTETLLTALANALEKQSA